MRFCRTTPRTCIDTVPPSRSQRTQLRRLSRGAEQGKKSQEFPPARCIAIDVDGTLLIDGKLNEPLAEWAALKKQEGFDVVLWSAQGRAHAVNVAVEFGIDSQFTAIISKPGYIVDDLGWSWTQYTETVPGFTN